MQRRVLRVREGQPEPHSPREEGTPFAVEAEVEVVGDGVVGDGDSERVGGGVDLRGEVAAEEVARELVEEDDEGEGAVGGGSEGEDGGGWG
jgi:hypothetical protein